MKTKELVYSVVNINNEDIADRTCNISAEVHVYPDNTVKAIHNGVVTSLPKEAKNGEQVSEKNNKLASWSDVNGVAIDRAGLADDEYMPVMMAVYNFSQAVRQMIANGEVVIVVYNPNE